MPMAMRICPNRGIGVSGFGWMNVMLWLKPQAVREKRREDGKERAGLRLSTAGQDADEDFCDGVGADDHGCIGFRD